MATLVSKFQINIPYFLPKLVKRLFRLFIFKDTNFSGIRLILVRKNIILYKNNQLFLRLKINKGSRPLKDGVDRINSNLFYGDYWGNPNRIPVNVYKVDLETKERSIFYQFKNIRHIHFVQKDQFDSNFMLVGTGDFNHESGIYRINIQTKEKSVIGEGSQSFRAVSILQMKDLLIWGSDDPNGDNFIYKYDKIEGKLKKMHQLAGPAYYSAMDKKGLMYLATTIEDRKRHRAIIYRSIDKGETWEEHLEFKKDIWHAKYFGYGLIEFADNQNELEELSYKLTGLKEIK